MTSPISGIDPSTYGGAATSTAPASNAAANGTNIDPQAFLKLLVTQLQYQDPTSPADMSSFMTQTATLTEVQTMSSMSTALTSLLTAQQTQAATDLIGKSVTYLDGNGAKVTGTVSGATLGTDGATLKVDGVLVSLAKVLEVNAPTTGAA